MKTCEVCEVLPAIKPEYTLIEGEHWLANLRETDQTLLGTSFITARRHVPELDSLTHEEDSELIVIRNALFRAIRASFEPLTFNFSCLKNLAFTNNPDNTPPDAAHVHWHLKPRYGTAPISFAGAVFEDPAPGAYLESFPRHTPSEATAKAIAQTIIKNL